ncbi:CFI-box-CTERM domain-containing protein [Microcella frigidaquae]|uniref:Serine/threonine protein kinase n=1 Tax=Microcella frigidaquae TaxID=424758 RepID=A0A840X4I0_9MICO|nr:CFI-box-CTERM domain-containing protein [Microcella frigidaquae]MBB5617151.1 serine/threonine protein kinase [Microcella frigidaquae]NHN45953.1 hypothetical protein [Microcella frigidaquae]
MSISVSETAERTLIFDPADLVAPDARLFIDTNVFMDTDPSRQGGLQKLFARVAPKIELGGSPVVVPTKVIAELTDQSATDPSGEDPDRVEAIKKAANALLFLQSASAQGLVRKDLGDDSNPYADDLFVDIFTAYAGHYAMALLTNDVTLLLRINLLGIERNVWLVAGRLSSEGLIECEVPQVLYERGLAKLRRIQRRLMTKDAGPRDQLEAASLEDTLEAFALATNVVVPDSPSRLAVTRKAETAPTVAAGAFPADTPFRGEDFPLKVAEVPGEGDEVLVEAASGAVRIRLADKLGTGGEGSVYAVSATDVVKVFDQDHITAHRQAKIELLAARGFTMAGIGFPRAIVKNLRGEFVGYVMPRATGRDFSKALFNPRRFRNEFPTWTKADLVDVAISFLEKVSYLHSLNIILGDINPKNLQVDADKKVWIIDADSWQLDGFPCPVGTEMFSAPSVIGKRYPEFLRSIEDERFAVATMLFMILITGQFPYARSGSDGDIVRLIKEGNFSFQYKENSNQDQPAGNWKYMWSHIQPNLKGLFWNTFHKDGDRYDDRPSDAEWLGAFRDFRRFLTSAESFDPMSNDVYPTRFKAMARDTPIYSCSECGTSMVGIWDGKSGRYAQPALCRACRSKLPKCVDCGKPKSSLKSGVCWNCNRKRNFAACVECGREKPHQSLIEGRCYDCNQGRCASCNRSVPKRYLVNALCDRCAPANCKDCGLPSQKSDITYGRCPSCHRNDVERQQRVRAEIAEKAKRDAELDPERLCTRCGKPFISRGNVAWHQRMGKTVPTKHKMGYGYTYPPECVPLPTPARTTSASRTSSPPPAAAKKPGGCYIATAVYGSYDSPPVRVLRRWRDEVLQTSAAGRVVIHFYYWASPRLVAALGERRVFTVSARFALDRFVRKLERAGFSRRPYQDH